MDLTPEVHEAIEVAIDKHLFNGDRVDYLTGLTVIGNQETGAPMVVTVITLRMNASVAGEYITGAFFVDTPVPTLEQLDGPIRDSLQSLRAQRIAHAKELIKGNQPSPVRKLELPQV